MKVALLGTFGINNTGDNLEAVALKNAINELIPNLEISVFSPHLRSHLRILMGSQKDKEINTLCHYVDLEHNEFWKNLRHFDALIIGGGGLLLPLPGFEPFILSGPQIDFQKLPGVAWNALGSQWSPLMDHRLTDWYSKLKKAAEIIAYISVRSITTQRLLERAGCPSKKINVVPDPVLNFKVPGKLTVESDLKKRFGLDTDKLLIGVSAGSELIKPQLKSFTEALLKVFNHLDKGKYQLFFFPFSLMYGDDKACKMIAEQCPESILIKEPLSIIEIWVLIGMSAAYLTGRYHGVISALSQGIPALILDCYLSNETMGSKLRDLVWQSGLDGCYLSPIIAIFDEPQTRCFLKIPARHDLSEYIEGKITQLLSPETKRLWEKTSEQQIENLNSHLQNMVQALGLYRK